MSWNPFRNRIAAGLFLTIGFAGSVWAADQPLIDLVPAEAIFVAHVKNASQLPEKFDASLLGKVRRDPKMQKLMAPAWDSFRADVLDDDEVGVALQAIREAMQSFEGEAVLSLVRFPFAAVMEDAQKGGDSQDPAVKSRRARAMEENLRVLAMGRVAREGDAFTAKCRAIADTIIEKVGEAGGDDPDKAELVSEKVDGEELHTLRLTNPKIEKPFDTLTYARVGDVGIIGMPRPAVEELMQSLKQGLKADPLTRGPFGVFQQRNPAADVHLHLNFEPLVEMAMQAAKKAEEAGLLGANVAAMGLTVQGIHDALGLADLQSMDMAVQLAGDATSVDGGIQYTKRSGLMNFLAYTEGTLPKADFVPRDASAASISLFSLEDLWKSLLVMVDKAVPNVAPMVKQQLGAVEAQLGISLEKDLFGNLKPEILSIQTSDVGEGAVPEDDIVLMLGLKNEQGFEVALGKVLAMVSGMTGFAFEPSEFLGHKLHSFEVPAMAPGANPQKISYLFAKGYFVLSIGKGEALRKVLSNIERPGKSLWEEPRLKAALARLEPGQSEINYMDIGSLMAEMGEVVRDVMGDDSFLDWEHLPSKEEWKTLLGFLLSATYVEKNGIFSKALLLPNAD